MPLIAYINDTFRVENQPYSIAEIATKLKEIHSPKITLDSVYRAVRTLEKRPATKDIVKPLDDQRPALYSAEAARRVARYITQSRTPQRPVSRETAKIPNSPQLQSNSDAESVAA